MAAPLMRTTYRISTRRKLPSLFFGCRERCFVIDKCCEDEKKTRNEGSSFSSFLTYSVTVFTSLAGIVFYNWKDEVIKTIGNAKDTCLPIVNAKSNPNDVNHYRDRYNFIADVVEISAPSVVYIEIKDQKRIDFFSGKPATSSNGSGFIVAEDGLVLTNAHVVMNKPNTSVKVNVRLQDGKIYNGVVEDIDFTSDLALVRIDKKNLPVLKLGDSSKLRPGEFVVAIGSPLALSNSITSGVVSSVNRQSEELGIHHKNMEYIQTDAAITFGNSGGPLVNLNGEAIGINAMKVTAGISFAIPIDYAKDFLKRAEMRRKNKGSLPVSHIEDAIRRRYMGITMVTLSPDMIYDLQQYQSNFIRQGVLIYRVMFGSPAYAGGLKPGDIITHVNGQIVKSVNDIYATLEKPGSILMTIYRNGSIFQREIEPEDF